MSNNMDRAMAYPRVSGSVQEDGTSLETQAAEMVKLANAMGYRIDPEDVLPEVGSGVNLFRPQLEKIRGMAAAGEIRALFVYTTDRLSRDPVDLLVLIREFNSHGVEVYFVQDPSDSSPEGELVKFVLGFSARREYALIRERTMRGKIAVARGGRPPVGSPYGIYGYDYNLVTKMRVVNETEAAVVRRIFQLYVEGWSRFRIATQLNEEGIPSKKGVYWSSTALRGLLSNTSYIGIDYYGKTKLVRGPDGKAKQVDVPREEWIEIRGFTPPLISEQIFAKAQERAASTQGRYRGKNARFYLMTGLASCGYCGRQLCGAGGDERNWYYRCNRWRPEHVTEDKRCKSGRIPGAWFEGLVWSHVMAMVQDPSDIIADLELNARTGGGEIGKEIERLSSEVAKARQEEERLLVLYRRGTVRVELLEAEMNRLTSSLDVLQRRLTALQEQRAQEMEVSTAGERIRDYCQRMLVGLEELDGEGKKALMSRLGVSVMAVKGDVMIRASIDPGLLLTEGTSA